MKLTNKATQVTALAVALMSGGSISAVAKVSTAKIFSNHMVIQRGLAAPVWGWDKPGTEVTVNFAGQTKQAKTNEKGRWEIKLDPLTVNTKGQTMVISGAGNDKITYQNILIGDVWICSGQSNMEWSVAQSHNAKQEIAAATHPMIRVFDVAGHNIAPVPLEQLPHKQSWLTVQPRTISRFSAVGYYFGRELQKESGVPIGLLGTNWGGTRVEPWTAPVGFRKQPELKQLSSKVDAQLLSTPTGKATWLNYAKQLDAWSHQVHASIQSGTTFPKQPVAPGPKGHNEPCSIYNAMVAPIVGYGVRGAIWYQGESNSGEGLAYLPKLKALVEGWREEWNQPKDFPMYFYVVKLAQFHQYNADPAGGDGFARVRVAQDRIQELPHTGVASAIDIGHPTDIHPRNKQDVGSRLAKWALRDVYGKKDTVVAGPTFKEMKVMGNTVTLSYNHVGSGLMIAKRPTAFTPVKATPNAKLASFAISGKDKVWHWADAVIEGNTIKLSSAKVAAPVAVRYAYRGNPKNANLYNKEGMPAVPFTTAQ